MTTSVINDWLVKVAFDDSEVTKGVTRVEKTLTKMEKTQARVSTKQSRRLEKENAALRRQNILEAQRLALRKKINQAEQLGIKNLKSSRGALGGTNPIKIRAKVLELDKQITMERKKQAQVKMKEAAAMRPIERKPVSQKEKKAWALRSDQRADLGFRIGGQLRRASREVDTTSDDFRRLEATAERLNRTLAKVGSRDDLARLREGMRRFREDVTTTTQRIRAQNRALERQKFINKSVSESARNLARSYVSVFAAIEGGRAALSVGRKFEGMGATMLLASGDPQAAAKDMMFVSNMSKQMGLSLTDTAQSFAKFGVAARSAGLSSEETQGVFKDLAGSIRAVGLTQDKANLAFLGFQQMLAGPVVQAQEMNQINEQMPQFTGIAKKALQEMGFEVENYRDAIKTGTVDSKEFVRITSRLMMEQAQQTGAYEKSINSIAAAEGRLATSLQLSVNAFWEGGGSKSYVQLLNQMAFLAESLKPTFRVLGAAVGSLSTIAAGALRTIGSVINSLASVFGTINNIIGDMTGINDGLDETEEKFSVIVSAFKSIRRVMEVIVGLFVLPFGYIERVLNQVAQLDFGSFGGLYRSLRQGSSNLQQQFGADAENKDMGALPFGFDTLFAGTGGRPSLRDQAMTPIGGGGGKVNSDNTATIQINVPSGDPEAIRKVVNDSLQNTFKVAVN